MSYYVRLKNIFYRSYNPRIYSDDYRMLSSFKKILDVPCGQGHFISQNPKTIVGVDYNDIAIKKCLAKNYNVVKANALSLPFENEYFDAVHCAHLIEHLNPFDAFALLKELDRILKKDGLLIIRTPLFHKLFFNEPTHVRPYPPTAIMALLNVTSKGDPTFYNEKFHYKLVSLKYYYQDLFQYRFEVAANPRKYFVLSTLKGIGMFLGKLKIKKIEAKEYSMVLRK